MSKGAKVTKLENEIQELKEKLSNAKSEAINWKHTAMSRHSTINQYAQTQVRLFQEMSDLKSSHAQELQRVATGLATTAAKAMNEIAQNADLRVLAAQRDTIGEAFKYLADSVSSKGGLTNGQG
jgi:chaperonin cofactor prefoldin